VTPILQRVKLQKSTPVASSCFTARRYARAVYAVMCLFVRPSVCLSQAGVVSKPMVSEKLRILPSGTLSQTPDFENFATISRSCCQQNSSSSSTVELVDDTYTTIDESWLFITSRSTVTLYLNYCDFLWICCTTCLQLTRF